MKTVQWVNSPVLMEAILRYEKGLLPRSMKLWIEKLLELNPNSKSKLLSKFPH